ncbi:acyltransferase [Mesorhizobium sp. M7A.F.Ca.US.006.01.1.1]|uniref:acyltransferase family protein n=1 Tax=Mesorhizobium sp. M7A.F.Ca.US.006.01.1.1 TaxID=2496707 RepID=UPI000FCA3970|nr:acyltransferase [Mesorhizobium sp. M7A.F.Ca.US.006.01.1.1]RUZ73377.1 acyltransferase [Mesorhizobium sp. M7A.F.Ca.US.006.01.1.1]
MGSARDSQLDALRAIAVTMVLYSHFFAAGGSSFWGHIGVRLFFVLSGFLITRLLLEARSAAEFETGPALRSFYIRRALRIFPPYFAVLGFVWLVDLDQSRGSLVWHALYLSNFWYALRNDWNPWVLCHFWSLSIEEQFYLAWPLVVLLVPRRRFEQICIGVIALSLAYRFYWPITATPALARDLLPPASMDALATGALLACWRSRGAALPHWMQFSWPAFAAAFLVIEWFGPPPADPMLEWAHWLVRQVLPLVPLMAIVAACSRGLGGTIGKLLDLPPLLGLGRISYGVYLYHPILLSLAVKAQPWIPLNVSEQGPGRFLIAGAATIVAASISWVVFERPLNSLKRHFPYVARTRAAQVGHGGWLATAAGGSPDGPTPALELQRTDARR